MIHEKNQQDAIKIKDAKLRNKQLIAQREKMEV